MSRTMPGSSPAGMAKDMGGAPVQPADGFGSWPGWPPAPLYPCTEKPMHPASMHRRV